MHKLLPEFFKHFLRLRGHRESKQRSRLTALPRHMGQNIYPEAESACWIGPLVCCQTLACRVWCRCAVRTYKVGYRKHTYHRESYCACLGSRQLRGRSEDTARHSAPVPYARALAARQGARWVGPLFFLPKASMSRTLLSILLCCTIGHVDRIIANAMLFSGSGATNYRLPSGTPNYQANIGRFANS